MSEPQFDLVVIGAGPGGYVGAIRAAQLGLSVACIEKEPALGGTCLRVGCIPSKALLESSELYHKTRKELAQHGIVVSGASLDLAAMLKRKDTIVRQLTTGIAVLFKKNKITRFVGSGSLAGQRDGLTLVVSTAQDGTRTELMAKNVLIATGSEPTVLRGVELDGDRVGTSTEALAYTSVPNHLIVIGAGVIGLELGSVWLRLGSQVTVLEYLDRILPGTDAEITTAALKVFKKQGMTFELGVKVTAAKVDGEVVTVSYAKGGVVQTINADRVMVAVGRRPHTANLGLDTLGVQVDNRGRIVTDPHFATNVPGIYAIGDVIAGPMLAHKAEEEAVACVERIVTGWGHVDYASIPGIVYTDPEIATVGQSEEELKAANIPYRKGSFPFMANGRAKALAQTDGLVKLLAHADTDQVLGCAIFGPRAGDLIAEVAVAMAFGASSEDIARACHAHPTLAEVVKEAALAVDGRALHI